MLNKLGALLKYEFLFYFRFLPPLYLVSVLLALAVRFQGNPKTNIFWGMGELFLGIILIVTIAAIPVFTTILIIQRFIDNFFKGPGSLMFTLPVTVWALVASKAIAAFCMVLMSAVTVTVSYLIFNTGTNNWILDIFNLSLIRIRANDPAVNILIILVALITIFQQICLIYAVITSSYILPRFRFAAACAMYLLIENLFVQRVFRFVSNYSDSYLNNAGPFLFRLPTGLATLALAALFFWSAGMLLSRSYNLE
jgi:ethanolamine transporter EutH